MASNHRARRRLINVIEIARFTFQGVPLRPNIHHTI
ncbi:hypothetical protein [Vibrio campbellii]